MRKKELKWHDGQHHFNQIKNRPMLLCSLGWYICAFLLISWGVSQVQNSFNGMSFFDWSITRNFWNFGGFQNKFSLTCDIIELEKNVIVFHPLPSPNIHSCVECFFVVFIEGKKTCKIKTMDTIYANHM